MISRIITLIILTVFLLSCSLTARIEKKEYRAEGRHAFKAPEPEPQSAAQQKAGITRADTARRITFLPGVNVNGQTIPVYDIKPIEVVAQSKTITEREGKVSVDFIVTLPKELQGSCRSVVITPRIHRDDSLIPLSGITIRGRLFDKIQRRNYWQYEKYVTGHPDTAARKAAFRRFISHPYTDGVRLDSIVHHSDDISYHYRQDISAPDIGSNTLAITLAGEVRAADGSTYPLPPSDTLHYNIASLTTLIDTTSRYVSLVVSKYVELKQRNYLLFDLDRSTLSDTLADNRQELQRIVSLMDKVFTDRQFHVDSIAITGSTSPEGSAGRNKTLSRERAQVLKDHLERYPTFGQYGDRTSVNFRTESKEELLELIARDENIPDAPGIVSYLEDTLEPVDEALSRVFPQDYPYIKENLYPLLRYVEIDYRLRRVGMVQDTLHTASPDTMYHRAVENLKKRKYHSALIVLSLYRDRNTAIALTSLGEDLQALEILDELEEHPVNLYLKAILHARCGHYARAREYYDSACRELPILEYRSRLDPEIYELLKTEH